MTALAGPRRFLSHRRPLNRFAVQGSASAEPAPGHSARQTEMLEIRRIVEADARGNHVLFPRRRRKLHPLQLADDLEHAVAAVELRTRLDVLPAEQETHEVRRRHCLDLPAEPAQRQPVNAGQQPALTPLFFHSPRREPAAQHRAHPLQGGQRDLDVGLAHPKAGR